MRKKEFVLFVSLDGGLFFYICIRHHKHIPERLMPLKSTNIWDDVREETDEESGSDLHGLNRRGRSSVRSGSSVETEESQQETSRSPHANRHGVSMKSLFKNRAG